MWRRRSPAGKNCAGNRPRCATASHIAPTTKKGNALRAARRNEPASPPSKAGARLSTTSCMHCQDNVAPRSRTSSLVSAGVAAAAPYARKARNREEFGTGVEHGHEEYPEDRLDRHGPHGISDGR